MIDPVEHLARDDKWQLGAGDSTRFAPTNPTWLDAPGFWDGATLGDVTVAPLFTVTLLDEEGHELLARVTSRRWTPAELTVQYRLGQGLTATEVRSVQPGGIFVSEWRFAAYRPGRVHLVAWTAQPLARVARDSAAFAGTLAFVFTVAAPDGSPRRLRAELGASGGATSWDAVRAERDERTPAWRLTPFAERWCAGTLPRDAGADGESTEGSFYAAVHRALAVDYGGASATFAMRLVADDQSGAAAAGGAAPKAGTFGGASRRRWTHYFDSLPRFRSSDPYLESLYWYRWYCIRLHGLCAEPRELRWLREVAPAQRVVRARVAEGPADALLALDAVAPDDAFVREIFPALQRCAERLLETRDADATGLFDLDADALDLSLRTHAAGIELGRLKGVDATVDAYTLLRALESLAPRANVDPSRWTALAQRTHDAVQTRLWDGARGMFSDLDPATGALTGVPCAVCFLPYGTDLADARHVAGLERHLLEPAEFLTAFPVASLAANDPRFSAEGVWQGRVLDRPRNGRAWPALTCRIADALARTARSHAPHLRGAAATLVRRFVRGFFEGGLLHRFSSHEHYNPFTGHASVHRRADDVSNGWISDLVFTQVMGIGADANGVTVDPLPLGLEHAELRGVLVRGREMDVVIRGDDVAVRVGGEIHRTSVGTPVYLRD